MEKFHSTRRPPTEGLMNPDLTISIITVCRNSGETIACTIESILSQKNTDVEYIVIDGASTDQTLEVIDPFVSRIDQLVSEPDFGIAHAFNKGIERASSDLIGLINADDQLLPGSLELVRRYFSEHPECQVLHGDVYLADDSRIIKRLKPSRFWWCPWRLVLFNHPATFVRKSVYEKWGGFSEKYRIAMDVEIFAKWSVHGVKIDYLPVPLVKMQTGGISTSQANLGYRESRVAFIQHGRNPFLANFHYGCKVGLNALLRLNA